MVRFASLLLVVLLLPAQGLACNLCTLMNANRLSLADEFPLAAAVAYGSIANPQLNALNNGTGTCDLVIEKILKADPDLAGRVIRMNRYIPVPDPKAPPKFIVFFNKTKTGLEPYRGVTVNSPEIVGYLEGVQKVRSGSRLDQLLYVANFLDHADEAIASDAFFEFARAKDAEVGQAGKALGIQRVRKLLDQPNLDSDRIGLYAFLLGCCGQESDADRLKKLWDSTGEQAAKAKNGILAGYILLKPNEGWTLAQSTLGDSKVNFIDRYTVLQAIRFFQGWKPEETRTQVSNCLKLLIVDGEMADLAIEDLRRWKRWDHSQLIVDQFGRSTHQAPIVRRAIVRYALCCPDAEASAFVARVRTSDAEMVKEVQEGLEYEGKGG